MALLVELPDDIFVLVGRILLDQLVLPLSSTDPLPAPDLYACSCYFRQVSKHLATVLWRDIPASRTAPWTSVFRIAAYYLAVGAHNCRVASGNGLVWGFVQCDVLRCLKNYPATWNNMVNLYQYARSGRMGWTTVLIYLAHHVRTLYANRKRRPCIRIIYRNGRQSMEARRFNEDHRLALDGATFLSEPFGSAFPPGAIVLFDDFTANYDGHTELILEHPRDVLFFGDKGRVDPRRIDRF